MDPTLKFNLAHIMLALNLVTLCLILLLICFSASVREGPGACTIGTVAGTACWMTCAIADSIASKDCGDVSLLMGMTSHAPIPLLRTKSLSIVGNQDLMASAPTASRTFQMSAPFALASYKDSTQNLADSPQLSSILSLTSAVLMSPETGSTLNTKGLITGPM